MGSIPIPLLRRFGRTGLAYPEIGLGTWTLANRDFGPVTRETAVAIIQRAQELGIRFIDTADVYGRGRVEELLGSILDPQPTAASPCVTVLASKIGNDFYHGGPSVKNLDPDYLDLALRRCEERLKRPVDLIQLHDPPSDALADGRVLEQLGRWRRDGRVRMIGLSTDRLEDIRLICRSDALDALQIPFNILRQELLLAALDDLDSWGGALIIRTPLEYGLLSGSLPPAIALSHQDWRRRAWSEEEAEIKRSAAAELAAALSETGRTPTQAALQFALLPPQVSVVIPGAHSVAQLESNCLASRAVPPLGAEQLHEIDRIVTGHGLVSDACRWLGRIGIRVLPVERRAPAGVNDTPPPGLARLFTPLQLGPLRLANRMVRSGTTERAADSSGRPSKAMATILAALAAGGAGLVVTGFVATDEASRASASHAVLGSRDDLAAWQTCLVQVRDLVPTPAPLCLQVGHGGRLALGGTTPDSDATLVDLFRRTAALAVEGGFDAIELHAAHGYLLSQRLGDSLYSGISLLRAIVEAVRAEIGPRTGLLVKANMSDFAPSGLSPESAADLAVAMAGMGLDAIEWSGWVPWAAAADSPSRAGEIDVAAEGFFAPFTRALRTRAPVWPALGCCGGWRTGSSMARAVEDGIDFVSLSRALIAEPDLPQRLRAGQTRAACDGCNRCLAKAIRPIYCPALE